MLASSKLILSVDVVVENSAGEKITKRADHVLVGEKILDDAESTVAQLLPLIKQAKFILWNGPLGMFENGYFPT